MSPPVEWGQELPGLRIVLYCSIQARRELLTGRGCRRRTHSLWGILFIYYPDWPFPGWFSWSCSGFRTSPVHKPLWNVGTQAELRGADGEPAEGCAIWPIGIHWALTDCWTAHLILKTQNELACLERVRNETISVLSLRICLSQYLGLVRAFGRMWEQYTHWKEPGKKMKHSRISQRNSTSHFQAKTLKLWLQVRTVKDLCDSYHLFELLSLRPGFHKNQQK